jgi:hypothetical protein
MSSASVCSRREPSKIAQGKQRASAPEGRIERSRHGLLNPMTVLGFHTAPPGRESLGRTFPQGFTLDYFRLFPPGRTALNASLFPHLELLIAPFCITQIPRFPPPVGYSPIGGKSESTSLRIKLKDGSRPFCNPAYSRNHQIVPMATLVKGRNLETSIQKYPGEVRRGRSVHY